jgi:hypothetical protein
MNETSETTSQAAKDKPKYIEHPGKQTLILDKDNFRLLVEHHDASGGALDATGLTLNWKGKGLSMILGKDELFALAQALDKMTGGVLHKDCGDCDTCERPDPDNPPDHDEEEN